MHPIPAKLAAQPATELSRNRTVSEKTGSTPPDIVEAASAEASIKAKAIGEKIRRLRLKRSIGLVELGRRTGMSASFLSQLETGRVIPTLRNLSRIALVFHKDLSYFFGEDKTNCFKIQRAKDRIRLRLGDKANPYLVSESMSSLIPDRSLVPCMAELLPGIDGAVFCPTVFPGQEFVYVMQGSIAFSTRNEIHVLERSDVLWVDGNTRREYRCNGDTPAKAMIVTCPKRA